MNLISRFIKRLRFRKSIKDDQSSNVVDSMVKARLLYRELSIKAHPDRNPSKEMEAAELMKKVSKNRYNYAALLLLEKEIHKMLNK